MGDAVVGWRALAASVAGAAHEAAGQPCADASAVRVLDGNALLAVAADGAGSSERAAEGALLACEAVVELATRCAQDGAGLGRAQLAGWVEIVRARLLRAAQEGQTELRAYSCTLLAAFVDAHHALFLQIGDGAIVYRAADGLYRPVFWPQTGEYANTTWFVTDEAAAERLQTAELDGVHELALFTDGLQGLALRFATRDAHGPFFEPMFERLRAEPPGELAALQSELRGFLDSAEVNRRTDDDKTLVLATRLAPAAARAGA